MPDMESTKYVVEIQADTSQAGQALDEASSKLSGMESKARKVGTAFTSAFSRMSSIGKDIGAFFKSWHQYSTEAPQKAAQAAKDMSEAAKSAAATGQKQAEAAKSVADEMNNAAEAAKTMANTNFSRWQKFTMPSGAFSKEADKIREKIAAIEQSMADMKNTKIPTDHYKWLQTEIAKAEKELQRYSDQAAKMQSFGEDHGKRWEKLQYDINLAHEKLADYTAELQYLNDSGAGFTGGDTTTAYAKMEAEKAKLEADLEQISAQGESKAHAVFRAIASGLAGAIKTATVTALSTVWSTLKKIAGVIPSIVSGIKKWRREHNHLSTSAKKIYNTFFNLLRMLKTRIKRKFISAVFEDMQATMGQIAQISPRFNTAISGLIASLKALGAQIIAAFEPIISIVAPILTRLVDLMTDAAGRLAELISAATGNNTWLKATKGQYDYASSVDKTTKRTKNATKANKEFQASVMGFDQLNKLSGSNSEDSALSDASLEEMQNNVDDTTTMLDELYEAFTNHDWKRVGSILGEGFTKAFSWISGKLGWLANGEKITAWLTGLTDALNGFIEGINGDQIGASIADIFNTLINSFEILTSKIDFKGLGAKLGRIVGTMISNINWKQLGKGIMNGIQGLVKTINGFISQKFKNEETGELRSIFGVIGESIADLLGSLFDTFDPNEWSDILAGLINGFFELITSLFADQTKWEEMASKLAQLLNQTVKKIDAGKLADGISALARTFTTVITTLVTEIEWGTIISKLIETLGQLDWGSVASAVGLLMIPSLGKKLIGAGFKWGLGKLGLGGAGAGAGAASGAASGAGAAGAGAAGAGAAGASGASGWLAGAVSSPVGMASIAALGYYALNKNDVDHDIAEMKKMAKDPSGYAKGIVEGTYKDDYQYTGATNWLTKILFGLDRNQTTTHIMEPVQRTQEQMQETQAMIQETQSQIQYTNSMSSFASSIVSGGSASDGATSAKMTNTTPNSSITQSVDSNGTWSGIANAIKNALISAATESASDDEEGDIVLVCDNIELARAVSRGNRRINKLQNPLVSIT